MERTPFAERPTSPWTAPCPKLTRSGGCRQGGRLGLSSDAMSSRTAARDLDRSLPGPRSLAPLGMTRGIGLVLRGPTVRGRKGLALRLAAAQEQPAADEHEDHDADADE